MPIRARSDIAFVGGLIRHVLHTDSYFREYVLHYTNAATLVNEDFKGPEDLDGVFSGFDPQTGRYDRTSWSYDGGEVAAPAGNREHATQAFSEKTGAGLMQGPVQRDETLEHPRTVFRQLMRYYACYTPEMVERVCGISQEDFRRVADTLVASGASAAGWRCASSASPAGPRRTTSRHCSTSPPG